MKEYPHHNIVTFRLTDEEKMLLKCLSKKRKITYSELLREALAAAGFLSSMVTEDDEMLIRSVPDN
jgi:predicted DNA-binding protein